MNNKNKNNNKNNNKQNNKKNTNNQKRRNKNDILIYITNINMSEYIIQTEIKILEHFKELVILEEQLKNLKITEKGNH